ncbi:MAG TPA: hypothetical protein VGH33_27585 [Isosphaeraceae bacterium]
MRAARAWLWLAVACAWAWSGPMPTARAQVMASGRQVTVFGVLATPGQGQDDPKLKEILPQLRTALPGHSFKLLKVNSKRVVAGEAIACELGDGYIATTQLVDPLDTNGKVQLRFDFSYGGYPQYQTLVSTPPNQVFYINRPLGDGARLIMGIGAR